MRSACERQDYPVLAYRPIYPTQPPVPERRRAARQGQRRTARADLLGQMALGELVETRGDAVECLI